MLRFFSVTASVSLGCLLLHEQFFVFFWEGELTPQQSTRPPTENAYMIYLGIRDIPANKYDCEGWHFVLKYDDTFQFIYF